MNKKQKKKCKKYAKKFMSAYHCKSRKARFGL